MEMDGPAFIHCYAPCPTGWRCESDLGIRLSRQVVQTGVYPLYEVVHGELRMTYKPPFLKPLKEYMKVQGRFRHLSDDDIAYLEERIRKQYAGIVNREVAEG